MDQTSQIIYPHELLLHINTPINRTKPGTKIKYHSHSTDYREKNRSFSKMKKESITNKTFLALAS